MKTSKHFISIFLVICIILQLLTVFVSASSYTTSISNGNFYYVKHVGSGKYWDIENESTDNGANLQIWTKYSNHQNQVFRFIKSGEYWKIVPWNSKKVLEVRDSRTDDGAPIAQWDNCNISCQKWKLISNSDGSVSFKNCNSGKYLDVNGNCSNDGTKIIQYSRNNSSAQKFKLYLLNSEDILNAVWTRKFDGSEFSWTKFNLNTRVTNYTRFHSKNMMYPNPTTKKFLAKVEYLDRKTVWQMVQTKSLKKSTLNQIIDVTKNEGSEEGAAVLLAKMGFKNVPFVGLAIGICEVLATRNSNNEWNKFANSIKYDDYGNTGIIKKTYISIGKQSYYGPLNNGTTAYGMKYNIVEVKTYTYTSWNGNGGFSTPNYSGSWTINYK